MGFGAASPPLPITSYYIIYWVPTSIALIFFFVRLAVKLTKNRGMQIDDFFVSFAAAAVLTDAILHTLMTPTSHNLGLIMLGLAQPGATFLEDVQEYLKLQFAAITLFWNILWAVKFSLLIFIWRLTDGLPTMRKWWWGVTIFNIIMWMSAVMSQYLNCRPLKTAFMIGEGACETLHPGTSARALLYAMGADIATDISIMALPLRLLYGLKINRKQKFGLVLIFSLGLLCVIFAVIRGVGSIVGDAIMPIWLGVWTQSESCVALIVACLPTLRTLLLSRSITGGSSDSPSNGYRYGSRKYGPGGSSYARNSRIGGSNHVKLDDLSESSHITKIEAGSSKQAQVSGMYYERNNSSEEALRGPVPGVAIHTNISVTSERAQATKEVF
ncbi:hypothetical protein TWF106_010146 [Orbilia oligospora]|uniref:Rhodopsin domain-containing protein n=1 Tax=Orbilia oligospora TaxID=2813651 RepID=A0A6G1MD80_ORBOL|nr:hypothetical protein TWF788_002304 [Orbilia oligospora]KAF3208788.1 hypothetical protein TWF679_007614 [Orbilia oligospora]KAF3211694.1 hypothetical protein TWF106_010146 [Orbilia oligospora]KAF3225798.1 hypothetical protein TWF191_005145 [Orbilia oligospora]KAF3254831.1 hypothetical protein TWF192_002914 [Orbilia oligospora]